MLKRTVLRCTLAVWSCLAPAVFANPGDPLVGDVFLDSYNGWTDTFAGTPAVGAQPNWGLHLRNGTLMENSDGRAADGTSANGDYKPYLMVNTLDSPSSYTLSATLATTDNDGLGLVFGYQDNDNYFRVGFRNEASGLGYPQGVAVQKVVAGTITQIAGPTTSFIPSASHVPFDVDVVVEGSSYAIYINGAATPVLSGGDPALAPGRFGIMSWGQRYAGSAAYWGTEAERIALTSAGDTIFEDTFTPPIAWRSLDMTNSAGERIGVLGGTFTLGNLHLDFRTGVIQEDSNAYTYATDTTPNIDFLSTAVVIDQPGSSTFGDYELRVRITDFDNDGVGALLRVQDASNFYRINFNSEGMGSGTNRPPQGLSVQKVRNGVWSELYRDNQSNVLFTFTPGQPFDLSVRAVGNTLAVQVIANPDGAANVIDYPLITDATNPLLTGTAGLSSWGNGTLGSPVRFMRYGGLPGPFLIEAGAPCPLHITAQPQDLRVCTGNGAEFAVQIADSEGTVHYQWRRNFVAIPAPQGTASTLVLSGSEAADDGAKYDCVITDDCGTVTSRAAKLTVRTGPDVVGPADAWAVVDGDATLKVTATGLGNLSYVWKRDNQIVPGESLSTLTLQNVQPTDSGAQFTCEITDDCGTTISRTATLTVNDSSAFTLILLPDTQNYSTSHPQIYDAQTQWIVDNRAARNIVMVLHEGDITNNNSAAEFTRARSSMGILDAAGVPYAIAPGNHDYDSSRGTLFNQDVYFGRNSPYAQQPTVGGFFEAGKTDNSYHLFSAGGRDWLVFAVEYGPRQQVVDWMNTVAAAYPDRYLILLTHAYMYSDDTRYDWATYGSSQSWNPHAYSIASLPGGVNDGQELWDKLVKLHPRWVFALNGHVLNDGTGYLASVGNHGNVVHQILANYQFRAEGGEGYLRIMEFLGDGDTVNVWTYSPWLDSYLTTPDQQFTLSLTQLPPPPPPITGVHAANIAVADADNLWTTPQTGPDPLSVISPANAADVSLALNGVPILRKQGVLLATVRQNSRNGFFGTAEVSQTNYFSGLDNDILQIATSRAVNGGEYNANVAATFFSFDDHWISGHVSASAGLLEHYGVAPGNLGHPATGRYTLTLDNVDAQTDGLLFAVGGQNSSNIIAAAPLPSGLGWDLAVRSNTATTFDAVQDGAWSFVYLAYSEPGLVGGRIAPNGTPVHSVGAFTLTHNEGLGVYRLNIPGKTPADGVLLLTVAGMETESAVTAPADNLIMYEASGNDFLITVRDRNGSASPLADGEFVFAFIGFDNALRSGPVPGDFDGDRDVDAADFTSFVSCFSGPGRAFIGLGCAGADLDGDTDVDQADFGLFQRCYSGADHPGDPACATLP